MKIFAALLLVFAFNSLAPAETKVGSLAPDFSLVDSEGTKRTLLENRGKWVVLEWLNHGCPFVRKHYDSGNMQSLQKKYKGKGVVWFSVISSAPGKQGFSSPDQANADRQKNGAVPSAILLDGNGEVGKRFGAQTTPHFFIINPKGELAYSGAIDDKPSTDVGDVAGAKNFVAAALDSGLAAEPIQVSTTKAYGCSVKYAH
jgi:hypothetical protein